MHYIVIFFQLLLFFYHQITTLVDLYPFNDVKSEPLKYKLPEIIGNGILFILPPIGFIFNIKILIDYAAIFYPILLIGMFFSWWIHYLYKPSAWWKKIYAQCFSRTIKILPAIKDNPIPDLNHCILHAIAVITTILTLYYIYYF